MIIGLLAATMLFVVPNETTLVNPSFGFEVANAWDRTIYVQFDRPCDIVGRCPAAWSQRRMMSAYRGPTIILIRHSDHVALLVYGDAKYTVADSKFCGLDGCKIRMCNQVKSSPGHCLDQADMAMAYTPLIQDRP